LVFWRSFRHTSYLSERADAVFGRRNQVVSAPAHEVAFVHKCSRGSLDLLGRIIYAGDGIIEAVMILGSRHD
jgi:hypothetical protein